MPAEAEAKVEPAEKNGCRKYTCVKLVDGVPTKTSRYECLRSDGCKFFQPNGFQIRGFAPRCIFYIHNHAECGSVDAIRAADQTRQSRTELKGGADK